MLAAKRFDSRNSALPAGMLCVLVGAVIAVNAPIKDALPIGLGGVVLAAACLRVGTFIGRCLTENPPLELRLLLGFVLLVYVLALPVRELGISILWPAALFLVAAMLVPLRGQNETSDDLVVTSLMALAVAGFAALWSLESTRRAADFWATGTYRLWVDFFSHAGVIAEFGDPRAQGRGSSQLADASPPFYHYAGYAIPALAVRITDMVPLRAVTSIWLPVGIFATALGVMALGRALVGIAGGAIALLMLEACPDPASYGLKQGYLSFHWNLETMPGSLYGLPCACAACCFLVSWCRNGDRRSLITSGLLLVAVFLLRAQIFVWLLGPWAAVAILGCRCIRGWAKATLIGAGALAAAVTMLTIARSEIDQSGVVPFVTRYLIWLHTMNGPTAYGGVYPWLTKRLGPIAAVVPGIGLACLAMGGIPLLTFLGGSIAVGRQGRLETIDVLPYATFVWAAMLMLLAPPPFTGNVNEFRQRGFVLVVVFLFCWNARWLVLLAPSWTRALPMAIAACIGLTVTTRCVATWKAPKMEWATEYVRTRVSPNLIAAAAWLRHSASPGNAFAEALADDQAVLFDDAGVVTALSGVPAWVARPGVQVLAGGSRAAETRHRLRVLARVGAAPDMVTALKPLRAAGVGFYIVTNHLEPRWDPTLS